MNIPGLLYSTVNTLRDRYTPASHTSTFRTTGQITPDEFVAAGDYLVFKFPTWSWADADPPSKRVAYLPPGKQFLVTRNVPCHRRVDDGAMHEESLVEGFGDGWLRTGSPSAARTRDVRTVDDAGNVGETSDDEDDIPDMEDDDDEAIIKDAGKANSHRTYTLYIAYSPYYRTPRLYLSGYRASDSQPLSPRLMMEDIVGDYKDKTVTLEDFPFFGSSVKMATVHPCRHASVMKTLLDRADAAVRRSRERKREIRRGKAKAVDVQPPKKEDDMAGLVEGIRYMDISGAEGLPGAADTDQAVDIAGAADSKLDGDRRGDKRGDRLGDSKPDDDIGGGDDWEEVQHDDDEDAAIRVDQYLVVFLKFIASVTPGIEHDFTMAV